VFTLQALPVCADDLPCAVGKDAGFSLHAGVAACAHERDKVRSLPLRSPRGGDGE